MHPAQSAPKSSIAWLPLTSCKGLSTGCARSNPPWEETASHRLSSRARRLFFESSSYITLNLCIVGCPEAKPVPSFAGHTLIEAGLTAFREFLSAALQQRISYPPEFFANGFEIIRRPAHCGRDLARDGQGVAPKLLALVGERQPNLSFVPRISRAMH